MMEYASQEAFIALEKRVADLESLVRRFKKLGPNKDSEDEFYKERDKMVDWLFTGGVHGEGPGDNT